MFWLTLGLFIACVGLHVVYDFWSTWKILRGPDGKLKTKDDGIEKNPIYLKLMKKFGVFNTLLATKSLQLLYYSGIFLGSVYGLIPANLAILLFFGMFGFGVYMFSKYNFKYDGIGES